MSGNEVRIGIKRAAITLTVVGVASLLLFRPASPWSDRTPHSVLAGAAVFAAYVFVEVKAIKFRFGRVSQSVTVVELPLLAGLVCLHPFAHLVIRLVAQGLGTYIRLRSSKSRNVNWVVLVNGWQGFIEVQVLTCVAYLLGFNARFDSTDLLVLGVAFLAMSAVAPITWLLILSDPSSRLPIKRVVKSNAGVFELSFVIFALFVLFLAILVANLTAAAVFVVFGTALVHPLRQYATLSTRAEETANLFHFSDLLSQSRDGADFATILDHAAKTARGGAAEVVLLNARNLPPGHALVLKGENRVSQLISSLPKEWPEIMSEGRSRIMMSSAPWNEAKTAMAAPLLVNGVAIGLMVVSSHGDEFHNFTDEDVVILETIGRHLALWLEQDRLIDALEVEIEERNHDALRDPITDLPNRAQFINSLNGWIEGQVDTSVLLLNLAHFKVVNEHYGHEAGDRLLASIAVRISETAPSDALVCRLGGDEFTVCLPGVPPSQAARVAEDLVRAFRQPYQIGGDEVEVGAAIGIAHYPTHGNDVTFLMRCADTAMYRAKSRTEGFFVHETPKALVGANSLARTVQLRRAIESFSIIPHYQPLVDIRTGKVTGFEALARWQVTPGEFARPDEFIALAEETHLIHELTVQMATQALTDLAMWREQPGLADLTVSVNLSPVSLGRADITEKFLSALDQLHLPPCALMVEITESRVMEDAERSIRHLRALTAQGLRLAIDDFGAGQTSLSYLADLPAHQLKIDRSFLLEAVEKPTARRLLATMIALGRDLEQTVTVEGVETSEHWNLVRDLGADKVQGYFVAKAMSTKAASLWLAVEAPNLLESLGVAPKPVITAARR